MSFRSAGAALLLACACAPAASPPPPTPAPTPPLAARLQADTVREAVLAPGVRHGYAWDARGPWAVHLVEVDLSACGVEVRTIKALDRVVGRETTSAMARRAGETLGRPVLAAINADFFSFDPPGVPEGPQVSAGEIVKSAGTHREALEDRRLRSQPVFGLGAAREPFLADVRTAGEVRLRGGASVALRAVNVPPPEGALGLYNRFSGERTPSDTGAVEVVVRRISVPTTAGEVERGVVLRIDTAAAGVALPGDGVVLAGRGEVARRLLAAAPGDTLAWFVRFPPAPERIVELVGGYPMLLRGGEPVFRMDEGLRAPFADVRHPRAALAWGADGRLLIVAVDGRQPGYSVGMTLDELADFLRGLGVTEALNLDGGGSTTLVVRGAIANRPSDRDGERPVANALAVLGAEAGSCGPGERTGR